MPIHLTPKQLAFGTLSFAAQLIIKLQTAQTPKEKFLLWVQYATRIEAHKKRGDFTQHPHQKIILGWIADSLRTGYSPDECVDHHQPPLFYALVYPQLTHFLLSKGADPNFRLNHFYKSYLHLLLAFHLATPVFSAEDYLLTAEILAAAGAVIHSQEERQQAPIDILLNNINAPQISIYAEQFKKITEHPRSFSAISTLNANDFQYTDTLPLTREEQVQVTLFNQGKYAEILAAHSHHLLTEEDLGNSTQPLIRGTIFHRMRLERNSHSSPSNRSFPSSSEIRDANNLNHSLSPAQLYYQLKKESAKDKLLAKLDYGSRPHLHEVLELINQLNDQDVHTTDHLGRNFLCLTVAASLNNDEYTQISEALIRKGVKINTPSAFSPLHYAAAQSSTRAIEFLLKHGAEVNAVDEKGETPLHLAMRSPTGARTSTVFLLIAHGADVNAKDKQGKAAKENIWVEEAIKKIEEYKASNRKNIPSLTLFSARAVITHHLSRDSLPQGCKDILDDYENRGQYKRFIGIGQCNP